jgi:hypothetical protein
MSDNGNRPRAQSLSKIPKATQAWMERRCEAFGDATSRPAGKPKDGVTYGKGKAS